MATIPATLSAASGRRLELSRQEAIVLGCLAVALLLQLYLAFAKGINWDEFFHFSLIHRHWRGEPVPMLQTPFVWLFGWLAGLPGDQIDHIQLTRALLLPFELVTIAATFGIARRFAKREAALLCALAYATGGWVFLHALALRADIIAAALLMSALWLLLCRPLRPAVWFAIALLLVVGCVATIKSALYAPAFLGAAWLRWHEAGGRWPPVRVIVGAILCLVLAIAALAVLAPAFIMQALALGIGSVERMFSGGLFPQGRYFVLEVAFAPVLALLIATAAVALTGEGGGRPRKLALAGLMAPLLATVFYRNAFPYFYAFILPPVVAASVPAAERLAARFGIAAMSLAMLATAVVLTAREDRAVLHRQRVVQEGLRAIFPEPVVYIDESGMIADFPRAVPHFASGWALANYRAAGVPEYSQALTQRPVPLLLLNGDNLAAIFVPPGGAGRLLPQDERTLRDNFIPHWGLVYVAGKHFAPGDAPLQADILVPGTYTVEGAPLTVGGHDLAPGDTIRLERGLLTIGGGRRAAATLRWGDQLQSPDFSWPSGPLFTDY